MFHFDFNKNISFDQSEGHERIEKKIEKFNQPSQASCTGSLVHEKRSNLYIKMNDESVMLVCVQINKQVKIYNAITSYKRERKKRELKELKQQRKHAVMFKGTDGFLCVCVFFSVVVAVQISVYLDFYEPCVFFLVSFIVFTFLLAEANSSGFTQIIWTHLDQ